MFALDTSVLTHFLQGSLDECTQLAGRHIEAKQAFLPPVVAAEILTLFGYDHTANLVIEKIDLLEIKKGYWQRAGMLRHSLHKKGLKLKLPDTLIAQSCIDHNVPLITSDTDFEKFIPFGLQLAK
jgi:predicted nucleic acid-binding protein